MNVWATGPSPSSLQGAGSGVPRTAGPAFADALAAALDGASQAVEGADARAGALAAGTGSIVDASIARAKADVVLEIAAVAASRISGAVNALLQTQV
jgi:flagellar hook-basal body complex protein FliE